MLISNIIGKAIISNRNALAFFYRVSPSFLVTNVIACDMKK